MSTATFRAPRSRGMLSGVLLVLLGLWGGLVPFVGPYWHFGFTPDQTWTTTSGRWWLEVLPAAVTVVAGLIVIAGANRVAASFGAFVAALAGAWFVVGGPLSMLWTDSGANAAGTPLGSAHRQILELLTMFTGLGALIIFFSAVALGRFMVVGAREVRRAEAREEAREEEAVRPVPGPDAPMTRPMSATSTEAETSTPETEEPLPQRTSLTRQQAGRPEPGHERSREQGYGQASPDAPGWDQQPPSVPADSRTSPSAPGYTAGPEQAGWQERTPAGPPADRPWSGRANPDPGRPDDKR